MSFQNVYLWDDTQKTKLIVSAGAALSTVSLALMSFDTFNEKVAWSCFNGTSASKDDEGGTPLPHNVDAFVDLVRQVEITHWAMDAADTAALLLRR